MRIKKTTVIFRFNVLPYENKDDSNVEYLLEHKQDTEVCNVILVNPMSQELGCTSQGLH